MKVRMKVPMATLGDPRLPGQVLDLSAAEAANLIAADFAEAAEETPAPAKSARKRQAATVETATEAPAETPEG